MVGVVGVVIAYNRTAIPQPNELANKQVSIVYYSDGKTELDRIAVAQDGNRESVPLSKVPEFIQDAHSRPRTGLLPEQRHLGRRHPARRQDERQRRDPGRRLHDHPAVRQELLPHRRTAPLPQGRRSSSRVKIDSQLSKSEILEKYLNTIYYGRGAYGIQSAAKAYFGKDVSKLTLGEGAVLASVIHAPVALRPRPGRPAEANLTKRYAYVLDGMVQEGWLSRAGQDAALPKIQPYKRQFSSAPTASSRPVKHELVSTGLSEQDIDNGGLRIVTTIDKKAQTAAITAMQDNLPKRGPAGRPRRGPARRRRRRRDVRRRRLLEVSSSTPRPRRSCRAPRTSSRSPSSPQCRSGVSTKTKFDGDQPQDIAGTTITNFGDRSYGMVDMRRMIGRSINTAFVNLNNTITPGADPAGGDRRRHPGEDAGARRDADQRPRHRLAPRHRHGHGLLDDRLAGRAGQAVLRQEGHVDDERLHATRPRPQTKRAFDKDVTADVTDAMTYTVKDGGTATKLPAPRPSGRRQDGHVVLREVDLVLRLRPAARGVDRHVQARRGRQPADADELRGHQPHGWHGPGRRLLRLHEGRPGQHGGPGLPERARCRRRQDPRPRRRPFTAAADHDDDAGADDDDHAGADHDDHAGADDDAGPDDDAGRPTRTRPRRRPTSTPTLTVPLAAAVEPGQHPLSQRCGPGASRA